jgi:hypothetical protein
MKLIQSKTLASAAASIEFTSIPQDGTDLLVLVSIRNTATSVGGGFRINGDTDSNYTTRVLQGTGSTVASTSFTSDNYVVLFENTSSNFTANTYSSWSIYIPNYTSAVAKSISVDAVSENNATLSRQGITASSWSLTSAITSLSFISSANTEARSTISLYKITKGSDGIVTTS